MTVLFLHENRTQKQSENGNGFTFGTQTFYYRSIFLFFEKIRLYSVRLRLVRTVQN